MIWNDEKYTWKWISDMPNGRWWPFWKKYESCVLIWNGEKYKHKWISDLGGHFFKTWKLRFDLKLRDIQMKRNFGYSKWAPATILKKIYEICVFVVTCSVRTLLLHMALTSYYIEGAYLLHMGATVETLYVTSTPYVIRLPICNTRQRHM